MHRHCPCNQQGGLRGLCAEGWGPELTLAISLPLPHIPGSLYTRTFTPEGLKSVAVLPLYSWNFVTVVCPWMSLGGATQTSLFLWRQLPKPAVVTGALRPAYRPRVLFTDSCGTEILSSGWSWERYGGRGQSPCPPTCLSAEDS